MFERFRLISHARESLILTLIYRFNKAVPKWELPPTVTTAGSLGRRWLCLRLSFLRSLTDFRVLPLGVVLCWLVAVLRLACCGYFHFFFFLFACAVEEEASREGSPVRWSDVVGRYVFNVRVSGAGSCPE
ncbi:hypothetical protein ACJJTC_002185 [Scirpophaga incertulas]